MENTIYKRNLSIIYKDFFFLKNKKNVQNPKYALLTFITNSPNLLGFLVLWLSSPHYPDQP